MKSSELHRTHRIGWLRAAVLGANDGIVSTASLIVGVAAAEATRNSVLRRPKGVMSELLTKRFQPLPHTISVNNSDMNLLTG